MLRNNRFIQITILLIAAIAIQFATVGCADKGKEESAEKKLTTSEIPATVSEEKALSAEDIPTAVLDAFKTSYPDVSVSETSLEIVDSITYYEVEFEVGVFESSVLYTADGTFVKVEEEIVVEELPDVVKQTVNKEYPKCELKEAERITRNDGTISYELEIMTGEDKLDIVVSAVGKILSTEQDEDEDDS